MRSLVEAFASTGWCVHSEDNGAFVNYPRARLMPNKEHEYEDTIEGWREG